MRELGHHRNSIPKIQRHRTPGNWTIAANRAWQSCGNQWSHLVLECPCEVDTVQIDDHPHGHNEDETAYGDSVLPRHLIMSRDDVDYAGTGQAEADGRKHNTSGPERKHHQRD